MPTWYTKQHAEGLTLLPEPIVYQSRAKRYSVTWGQRNLHMSPARTMEDDGHFMAQFERFRFTCRHVEERDALEKLKDFGKRPNEGAFWRFTPAAARELALKAMIKGAAAKLDGENPDFSAGGFIAAIGALQDEDRLPRKAGPAIIVGVKDTAAAPRRVRGPDKQKRKPRTVK